MAAKPIQNSHNDGRVKTAGHSENWFTKNVIRPARKHCWFWIPMVGVTAISGMVSSMFIMGGFVTNGIEGEVEITIALFCTGALFIIVPPIITFAILRSASPPAEPSAENETDQE